MIFSSDSLLYNEVSSSLFSLDRKVRALNKLLFVFISIFLVLLAGLRYEIGVDYDTYRTHYDYIPDVLHYYRYDASMEAGYEFVTSVFKFHHQLNNLVFSVMSRRRCVRSF